MSKSSYPHAVAMSALVQRLGCLDAVVELLRARWGAGVSKGTISRKMGGDLDWTIKDMIALEDALGEYSVTRMLARRMQSDVGGCSIPLAAQTAVIARECGEALAAILSAEQSSSGDDRAQAVVEIDQAIEALKRARAKLEDDQ